MLLILSLDPENRQRQCYLRKEEKHLQKGFQTLFLFFLSSRFYFIPQPKVSMALEN